MERKNRVFDVWKHFGFPKTVVWVVCPSPRRADNKQYADTAGVAPHLATLLQKAQLVMGTHICRLKRPIIVQIIHATAMFQVNVDFVNADRTFPILNFCLNFCSFLNIAINILSWTCSRDIITS